MDTVESKEIATSHVDDAYVAKQSMVMDKNGRWWNWRVIANHVGVSILTNVCPVYLSELIPANFRARAVGFTVAGSGVLSVVATVVVWATEKLRDQWQYKIPLLVQAVFPATLALLSLLLTESPVWLLAKGRHDDARRSLLLLRGGNAALVEKELALAAAALKSHSEQVNVNVWEILKPANLERTISASAPLCLSQVGGQILVLTYSTVILVQSGVADPFKITIIIFLLQFLGTLIGPFLLDKIGRRPVALTGFVVLFAIDVVCGALACAGLATQSQRIGLAALCIVFSFINATCFQSIAYVLPTEVPTSRLRESTMAWTTFWSYTTAIITTFAVPQITNADAPETSNRTLAEIDELYAERIPKRHWKGYKSTANEIDNDNADR
ncbi:MFS transporter, SP family, general alpha glucoside:H+ symporter [Metarhizium guizhouense ARSEF 977]|uniref:MFS transporter, SP family, general alpha glucoside:H+ symporter n=1 Tax=Metarhizium guizhouense (strain ARSEF 977) TaxID=1276136 RepID=A0A0B4IAR2_METGA|nr:MFS transporter, SP family, general alpha glucoside:H+ symporter [Metarhizium guizhouense ARSEF 977]